MPRRRLKSPCLQYDLFNEIAILEMLPESCASKLLEYGINRENMVLVQRRYRTSLSAWRQRQPVNPGSQLRLYLNIFAAVLMALKVSDSDYLLDPICLSSGEILPCWCSQTCCSALGDVRKTSSEACWMS